MFLAVGHWMIVTGSDRLADLRGMAQRMPMTAFAFALAAITLMGLPPSGGFTGKYLVMTAAFASGQWAWALVMAGGGLAGRRLSLPPRRSDLRTRRRHPGLPTVAARQMVPLLLAGASIALGIASAAPFELLSVGRPEAAEEGL
jgi:multicomponent Na+:H+ antiporter subunit D